MGDRFKLFLAGAALGSLAMSFSARDAFGQYAGPAVASVPRLAGAPDAASKVTYAEYQILPGDIVAISTLGAPELTTSGTTVLPSLTGTGSIPVMGIRIGPTGQISLPYLGAVTLAGLTSTEAGSFLSKELKDRGILVNPQVSVALMASPARVVTVLGEVLRPGPIPSSEQLRLLDVISACGGFTPLASHTVTVQRMGESDPITIELGVDARMSGVTNIPLLPGDTVIVSKVGNVFVVGEVKTEEAYPLSGNAPITVMRAISLAGGLKYSAALSKARIIRTTADNRHVAIMLDLKKLMNGKQQDVALMSDDVLFIPANTFKLALASGAASIASSLFYGATYAAVSIK